MGTDEPEQQMERAVALGLMEQTTDGSVRVPRVLPLVVPEDNALAGLAARELYRWWSSEAESSSEAQRLEIHRLAMVGEEGEIAAEIAYQLAEQYRRKSRFKEAVSLCQKSLQVAQSHKVSLVLATSAREIGDVEVALKFFEQALDNCPDEDESLKASILHESAILKANQGDVEEAIALYEESLAIQEKIGNAQGKAATLRKVGGLYQQQGQTEKAMSMFQESLEITKKIDNAQGIAESLGWIAGLKNTQGDVEGAIALYEESLVITEKIGDVKTKAATLHQMANLKGNQGDVEGAIALYEESLVIEEKIGNAQGKAATLHQMANLKANQGDVEGAIALYEEVLEIDAKTGDAQGKAATLHEMASLKGNQGDVEGAIALYEQSLVITEKIGNAQGKAVTLATLAPLIAAHCQDIKTAVAYLQESISILQQIRSPMAEQAQGILINLISEQIQQSSDAERFSQSLESDDQTDAREIFQEWLAKYQ